MESIAEKLRQRPDFGFLELERRVQKDDEGFLSMVKALHQSKTIRYIYVCGKFFESLSQDQRRLLFEAIQNLESLRALYLANANLTMGAVHDLANLLNSCKAAIQELSFQHLQIPPDVSLDPLINAAAKLPFLEKIELGILFMHHEGAACLKESLAKLCESTSLQALTLIDLRLDQEHIATMAKKLATNVTLKELHLWGEYAGSALQDLANMVEVNRSLHTLCLYFATIENCGMEALAKSLGQNTGIRSLSIEHEGDSIQQEGILAISRMLEENQQLETLSLASKSLEGEGWVRLCHALSHHLSLKELSLDNVVDTEDHSSSQNDSIVGFNGIDALTNLLQTNTVLERMDLSGLSLGQSEVVSLASALRHNSTLRELTLGSFRDKDATTNDNKDRAAVALEELLEHNKVLGKLSIDDEEISDQEGKTQFLLALNHFKLRTLMVDMNSTREAFVRTLGDRAFDINSLYYLLAMNPSFVQMRVNGSNVATQDFEGAA